MQMAGWGSGLLGVIIFSASLPATRVAVGDFDPFFLTAARAVIASVLAVSLLVMLKQPMPKRKDFLSLLIVAVGVVIGFPLLTALALQTVTSAHSIVFIGLLPLSTAVFGVIRGGERPKIPFWLFSVIGSALVGGFAWTQGANGSFEGNLYMIAAIVVCGLGYAEGATLSRSLGGWQVISWALLLAFPIMAAFSIITLPPTFANISAPAWIGLGYVSLFSMLIGFVFWYRGLAIGGISGVSQLQLLQPFFGLALAGFILRETVELSMIGVTILVISCVICAKRFT